MKAITSGLGWLVGHHMKLGRHFSNATNLTSTFKAKNFLKEFFKYVHPDILHNAPERVREENSRSLQTLNAYMDKVKKNQGGEGVEVRFYTPEKTNRKNKKYYFFKARLEAFQGNLKEGDLEELRRKIADNLLNNLNEVIEVKTGAANKDAQSVMGIGGGKEKLPAGYVDIDSATFDSHPGLFKKNSAKHSEYLSEMNLIDRAYSDYLKKSENDELLREIADSILLVDPGNRRKNEYARDLLKNLEFMKNKDILITNVFDPRYILLDKGVGDKEIFNFSKRVDKSPHKKACAADLVKVFDVLREHHPSLAIVLSSRYSTEVPGCLHINSKDDLKTITKFLVDNVDNALDAFLTVVRS